MPRGCDCILWKLWGCRLFVHCNYLLFSALHAVWPWRILLGLGICTTWSYLFTQAVFPTLALLCKLNCSVLRNCLGSSFLASSILVICSPFHVRLWLLPDPFFLCQARVPLCSPSYNVLFNLFQSLWKLHVPKWVFRVTHFCDFARPISLLIVVGLLFVRLSAVKFYLGDR